jgi:hypothetical protein
LGFSTWAIDAREGAEKLKGWKPLGIYLNTYIGVRIPVISDDPRTSFYKQIILREVKYTFKHTLFACVLDP